MSFFDTLEQMVVIFFAVAVGFAARKMKVLSEETTRYLTNLVLTFLMPCKILASVTNGTELPSVGIILEVLKMSLVFYGTGAVFLLIVPRLLGGTDKQKGVWCYVMMFPNTAFVGYPVIETMYGAGAVFYAVLLNLPFNLLNYSMAPLLLAGQRRFSLKQSFSPCVIASFVSLIIALVGLQAPALVGNTVSFVGESAMPMSLVVLGSVLANTSIRGALTSPRIWILSLIRLLVLPVVMLLVMRPLHMDSLVMGVGVLEGGMPSAISGTMLSLQYGGDVDCITQVILLSTLLSMVTIPLVAMLL